MNILLVDDNEDYLQVIAESLKLGGFNVQTATDGSEACTLLERSEFDLIMSDIKMPTLDGIMLHAHARELDRYKRTKFVFISSYGDAYAEILDLDPEVDFFLSKTTSINELLKFVNDLLFGEFAGSRV